MTDNLRVDDPRAGVRTLTLNRPERLNALDGDLVAALRSEIANAGSDIRVIVIQSEGRAFCAGADLKWLASGILADHSAHAQFQEALGSLFTEIESASQAVIAAVNGYAFAGGLELTLACDIVVVSDDAQVGDEHINKNLLPGGGGSQRLPRKIGLARGLEVLLTGRRMTGQQVVDYGLAVKCVSIAELHAEALEMATILALKDGQAIKYMKQMVRRGIELPLREGLSLELYLQSRYRADSAAMDEGVANFAKSGA